MLDLEDHNSLKYRTISPLLKNLVYLMQVFYYQDSMFAPDLLYTKSDSKRLFVIGHGVPGIRDILQQPQNMGVFYPITKEGGKMFLNSSALTGTDYDTFLNTHKKNVLISFGTTFMPSEETCYRLLEFIESQPDIGFIVSLKDQSPNQGKGVKANTIFDAGIK